MMKWIWPRIESIADAHDALGQSAMWLFFLCALNGLLNAYALYAGHAVFGADGGGLIDAVLFAVIGWRLLRHSLPWAIAGLLIYLFEIIYTLSESHKPSLLGIIIFFSLLSGVRAAWYIRTQKVSTQPPARKQKTPSSVPPPPPFTPVSLPESNSLPLWFNDVRDWIAVRLASTELQILNSEPYREHLQRSVLAARSSVLTNEEFVSLCKVTSSALVYRTYLAIEGVVAEIDGAEIVFAMLGTLPNYSTFYSLEDISTGAVPLIVLTKSSILEGEMYGLLYAFFTKDNFRFSKLVSEMSSAAKAYWAEPFNRTRLRNLPD